MRARRRFGQHFLEPGWVERVVEAIAPGAGERFLEIGPGRGALTLALAPRVGELLAVEIDRDLAPALARHLPANARVLEADFLRADAAALQLATPFRVVGNLPYNISSPILFRLLDLSEDGRSIPDATVMLQREVAERLTAQPGGREWGVLSACQQLRARAEIAFTLPPGAFRPAPKVHSAVVRLRYHPAQPALLSRDIFDALVRSVFTLRRKMLSNALAPFAASRGMAAGEALAAAGLDGTRRPETLQVAELARLADVFASV